MNCAAILRLKLVIPLFQGEISCLCFLLELTVSLDLGQCSASLLFIVDNDSDSSLETVLPILRDGFVVGELLKSVTFILIWLWINIWEVLEVGLDSSILNVVDQSFFFFKLVVAVLECWVFTGL